jgi:hypothetical protein
LLIEVALPEPRGRGQFAGVRIATFLVGQLPKKTANRDEEIVSRRLEATQAYVARRQVRISIHLAVLLIGCLSNLLPELGAIGQKT